MQNIIKILLLMSLRLNGGKQMEYKTVVKPNGIINHYPILTEGEREEKNQEFLKKMDKLIEKYKDKKEEKQKVYFQL